MFVVVTTILIFENVLLFCCILIVWDNKTFSQSLAVITRICCILQRPSPSICVTKQNETSTISALYNSG